MIYMINFVSNDRSRKFRKFSGHVPPIPRFVLSFLKIHEGMHCKTSQRHSFHEALTLTEGEKKHIHTRAHKDDSVLLFMSFQNHPVRIF